MAPRLEEQAPSSGGRLALSSKASYLKHEQPGIGLEGSGLPNVLGSESPGVAAGLNAVYSVAPLEVLFSTNEMDPKLPHFEYIKHCYEASYLKALEVLVDEVEWRVFLAKRMKEGSNEKLESVAEVDEIAEEEEDSPS